MFTLEELAKRFGAELVGDKNCRIERVSTLENAGSGAISFLANAKYRRHLHSTCASAVIVLPKYKDNLRTNGLIVANPYLVYAKVVALLYPEAESPSGVHPSAVVDTGAKIDDTATVGPLSVVEDGVTVGAHAYIGPGCVVSKAASIGSHVRLVANVTIYAGTVIGHRTLIHAGVVIGADGFGLANDNGAWLKIPQIGCVRIGDDVEIGANTTIDRGAIEDTVIASGVKLDNLIQVGHNVQIGANTAVAAATAIAGSVKIGKNCQIAGKVGIVGHTEIADNITITGMSMVAQSIKKAGVYSGGTPLETNARWHRNYIRYKQLDEMARNIKQLKKRLDEEK